MGNYRIIIEGVGAHDNGPNSPGDAQHLADSFAGELRRKGHSISLARFERVQVIAGRSEVTSHIDLLTRKDSRPAPVRLPRAVASQQPEPRVETGTPAPSDDQVAPARERQEIGPGDVGTIGDDLDAPVNT